MDRVEQRRIAQAGKDVDPGWYRVHRNLSIHLTRVGIALGVTANQASVAMLLVGVVGAALIVPAAPGLNALGFVVLYCAFLLDKVDGELARLTGTQNARGIFLDRMHHRLVEPGLFIAVAAHEYMRSDWAGVLVAGFVTVILANAIDENQHLAAYILYKRVREGERLPDGVPPRRSAEWGRAAALLRPLKGFRMFIVALPLLAAAYAIEAFSGRMAPTLVLIVSAVGLFAYLVFQCLYYLREQLDTEAQAIARVFRNDLNPPTPRPRPAEGQTAASQGVVPMNRPSLKYGRTLLAVGVVLSTLSGSSDRVGAAGTYYVDVQSSACSNTGPGSASEPYCTISAAVAARNGPGTTIRVWPGRYTEQVDVPASGAQGSPFVIEGLGSPVNPVILDGSVDLSDPAQWSPAANTTWLAASASWSVLQVLADGVRLVPFAGGADSVPVGSFRSVPGVGLYVNLGGANPGDRTTLAGRLSHGVRINGLSWVTVRGLSIRWYNSRGIFMAGGGNHVIEDNVVDRVGRYGINAEGTTGVLIARNRVTNNGNHGIALTTGATATTVESNESSGNARPEARAANGIYLFNAPGNLIRRNRLHHNQDSGLHVQAGSNGNVAVRNVAWANGDHGFDHLGVTNNVHVNDVAYGNFVDGFSFEGNTLNQRMTNCISAMNGMTTGRYQLYVDSSSTNGFVADDNILWGPAPARPVRFHLTEYPTVAAYSSAIGQDTRTLELDPQFYSGGMGDFRLLGGSPAIDAANSDLPQFESADLEGFFASDDPATPNTGLGGIPFADRGAYEFGTTGLVDVPEDLRPVIERVSPNPLFVTGVLTFATSRPGALAVDVHDVRGRRVRRLLAETSAAAGPHALQLDARDEDGSRLETGVYFYRIRSVDGLRQGKFVVVR